MRWNKPSGDLLRTRLAAKDLKSVKKAVQIAPGEVVYNAVRELYYGRPGQKLEALEDCHIPSFGDMLSVVFAIYLLKDIVLHLQEEADLKGEGGVWKRIKEELLSMDKGGRTRPVNLWKEFDL